jgi:TolB-like protein
MRRHDAKTARRHARDPWLALLLAILPPCRLAALQCPDGTPPPCNRAVRAAPAPTSVAVLSFDNRSRDTADAFLADGLADEISTRLGQIGRLAIVSRSQVRRLHGVESMPIPAIGRALNTANLVHGSVQGTPTHLRVSVELLRASNATQVWSHVYDRGRSDLLEIQGDIATEVAQQITGALRPGDRAALTRHPTSSPEAYEHILRGDVLVTSRNRAQMVVALREYQSAATLDPQSARAQASLAKVYTLCREYRCPGDVPLDTFVARASRPSDRKSVV